MENTTTNIEEWYEKHYTTQNWSKKHLTPDAVIAHFVKFLTEKSELTRDTCLSDLNVSYGASERSKIDYFYGETSKETTSKKPVIVYIHGGYWQQSHKDLYSSVIEPFTRHKFNTAVIGYDLAPACSISQIISKVANAVDAVYAHFNQSKLIVYGHSAGAYLAAVIARTKPNLIRNVVLISGVYDLSPLIKTSRNQALKLTINQAEDLTKMVFDYDVPVPAHIFVGEDESPEFIKQSEMFYKRLVEKQVPCTFKILPNEDHFSIIENLTDENSIICRDMMLHTDKN